MRYYILYIAFLFITQISIAQEKKADLRVITIEKIINNDLSDYTAKDVNFIYSKLYAEDFKKIINSKSYFDHLKNETIILSEEEIKKLNAHFIYDSLFKIPFSISISKSVLNINLEMIVIESFTITDCEIKADLIKSYNRLGEQIENIWVSEIPKISKCGISFLTLWTTLKNRETNESLALQIEKSTISILEIQNLNNDVLSINNCNLTNVELYNISSQNIEISNNIFESKAYKIPAFFYDDGLGNQKEKKEVIEYSEVFFNITSSNQFSLKNNTYNNILKEDNQLFQMILIGKVYKAIISKNTIKTGLSLNYFEIERSLKMTDNIFNKVALNKFIFPELRNEIYWSDFSKFKISFLPSEIFLHPLFGETFDQFDTASFSGNSKINDTNNTDFLQLIRVYQNMHDIFKVNGDKESANQCYAEMKLVETNRWLYLYTQNKSFENFFRWQLSVFLNYFTDYGTNPAKAVIKSGRVILLFSIFYLFFPSDWDVTNRAEFLKRWKELLRGRTKEQRQKSSLAFFFSSLFFILYTGFIHLLNALTLSLNAFTTLGFGDIPTHGAARYVTIVQGFIGWFLLTIFSVSLINQVLG